MDILKKDLAKILELQLEKERGMQSQFENHLAQLKELRDKATKLFKPEKTAVPAQNNSKRLKRLNEVSEREEEETEDQDPVVVVPPSRLSKKNSSESLKAKKSSVVKSNKPDKISLASQSSLDEDNKENESNSEPLNIIVESELRPVRTAKAKANNNLKEPSISSKLRNDNNTAVMVKIERQDSMDKSRIQKKSDEGISSLNSGSENEVPAKKVKRSDSLEIISAKPVEIELSSDEDAEKMPPPALPAPKPMKKTRTKKKQSTASTSSNSSTSSPPSNAAVPLRITRSKIKKEPEEKKKAPAVPPRVVAETTIETDTTVGNLDQSKKKQRKKKGCPMPIVVKLERLSTEQKTPETSPEIVIESPEPVEEPRNQKAPVPAPRTQTKPPSPARSEQSVYEDAMPGTSGSQKVTVTSPVLEPLNSTYKVNNGNDTFIVPGSTSADTTRTINNETVTLEPNPRASIMTEDDDEELPLSTFKAPPPIPVKPTLTPKIVIKPGTSKKNEVFNPYVQSPVKKKVEAFEKHAYQTVFTPDKNKANNLVKSVSNLLPKSTTPMSSRFGLVTSSKSGTTPQNTGTLPKAASALKPRQVKKMPSTKSLSQESLDDVRKKNQVMDAKEERKRINEEKQRLAKLQREQLEKEKREQAERLQKEKEEKLKKLKAEREEKLKMDQLKKKLLKEKQEKKFAEEKEKEKNAAKDTSLYVKMQKQLIRDKTEAEKRELVKNTYHFDMLLTDDSTDDESRPNPKRPPPPAWSQKAERRLAISKQSYLSTDVIDSLFSIQPMTVNLKEIFPAIEPRKLVRNSSAVWRTPPRYSQMPKY